MRIEKGFVRRLVIDISVFIFMAGVLGNPSVSQAAYAILHSFGGGSDGANPLGSLNLSVFTTLYGMTSGEDNGGDSGTILQINTDGTGYQVLHSFGHGDGADPQGSLTLSGFTLYGMTRFGGADGLGTIFKINTEGTGYQVLHSFGRAANDGTNPYGSLTPSGATLYGMTEAGGVVGYGTIFQIYTDGSGYQVLHSFDYGDGADPQGSLTLLGFTLYGMTRFGGANGLGAIFKVNTEGTGYQVLHSFGGGNDGANPLGSLTLSGFTLYGMTHGEDNGGDYGTIFQINTDGTGYQVLHSFGYGDGARPYGSLTLSGSTLYGMTSNGGAYGYGTVFQINTDDTGFQVMHSFNIATNDGASPHGSLTLSGSTLYGMAEYGGAYGYGTIFSLGVTPGAPTGVTAKPGNATATVSFTPPAPNGGSAITGYTVTSNPAGGVDASAGTTSTTHTVKGLTNGTAYTFTVTATNAAGTGPPSSPSNSVTPTTSSAVPGAPKGVTAKAGNARATVSFKLRASNGSTITGCTAISNPGGLTGTGLGSPITVANLTNGTAYTFTVKATNGIGNGPASVPSNSVTPYTVPDAPLDVTAKPGNTKATVSFKAPASNGRPITGYTVTSSPGGIIANGASIPITVKGLTNGTAYTFTVTATNKAGTGAASNASSPVTAE